MLAVCEVEETEDLARALSRLFAAGSPWRERLTGQRCYLRYAVATNTEDRQRAAEALKNWLTAQRDSADQICESASAQPAEIEAATQAERAVDRVTRAREYGKVFPIAI